MKLASVCQTGDGAEASDGWRLGVVVDNDAAVALLPPELLDIPAVIRGGPAALDAVHAALPQAPVVGLETVKLDAPIRRFNRDVLCTGWNYVDHFQESHGLRDGQEPEEMPKHPTFFTKGPGTVVGPRDDIAYDGRLSSKWDYEAEVALVIGRSGRSIREADALDHVFGFCVANDISQRDLQRAHGGQWLKGKSIDCTMPFGPWITTDVEDPHALRVQCEVNGEMLQDASTGQVAFSFARIIAELSWGMTLQAGDVILTGTPSGVGNARDPQVFLTDGDLVVTRVSGLGELRNRVVRTSLT